MTHSSKLLYVIGEISLYCREKLENMGWTITTNDPTDKEVKQMPSWNIQRSPDSFPRSFHKALAEEGSHLLAENISPRDHKYEARKFSLFKACIRARPGHPLREVLAHVRTRISYSHGCLWCKTEFIPMSILASGKIGEIFPEDHPKKD